MIYTWVLKLRCLFEKKFQGVNTSCTCCDTQDAMTVQAGGDDFSNNPIMVGWVKQFENHVGPKVFAIAEEILVFQVFFSSFK